MVNEKKFFYHFYYFSGERLCGELTEVRDKYNTMQIKKF